MKYVGSFLLFIGILFNEYFIRKVFTPYGHLSNINVIIIRIFDLITILSGIIFLKYYYSPKLKKLFFYTLSLMIFGILSFGILEVVARIASPVSVFHPKLELRPYQKRIYFPDLDGISKKTVCTTNSYGMRGDEPPVVMSDFYTIITVGGSTTECLYLDDKNTWPYLLQEKLKRNTGNNRIWVGNGGIDGHSSRGHVLFVKNVIPVVKPDCIIILCGVNDLWISLIDDYRNIGIPQELGHFRYKIFASSRFLQILNMWKKVLIDKEPVITNAGHEKITFEKLTEKETAIKGTIDEFLLVLPEYRKNLIDIITSSRRHNVRLIFLTQPFLFDDTDYWKTIKARTIWVNNIKYNFSAATWWLLLNRINEELISVCKETDTEYINTALMIPHSKKYFYDTMHFNELGTDIFSGIITEYMIRTKETINHAGIRKD